MKSRYFLILIFSFIASSAWADDTEVYLGNPDAQKVKPNVLFIFDTSGSMQNKLCDQWDEKDERVCQGGFDWRGRWDSCLAYTTQKVKYCKKQSSLSRLQVTQNAAKKSIDNLTGVNLALMQFNNVIYGDAGLMKMPMKSVDDPTHKDNLKQTIDGFQANSATPIVESTHEAYLFMTGGKAAYGTKIEYEVCSSWWDCEIKQLAGNHAETLNGANYISPITETCQKNHIVLFTDGGSTRDGGRDSAIRNLMKDNFSQSDLNGTDLGFTCTSNNSSDENNESWAKTSCLRDIAYLMNHSDASPLEGKQTIQFHAIGGFIGGMLQETLDDAANYGGGVSANAQDAEELDAALQKVFQNIVQSSGTFAAPTVSVNAFNSLEQLDQVYYSVFKPHEAVGWSGNVKRFRLSGKNIVDANGANAVDSSTGFFKEDSKSYWSPDVDGGSITDGGMASRLQDNRQVVSNLVSNELMAENNRIRSANKNVTQDVMGTQLKDQNFGGYDVDPDRDNGYSDPYSANEFTKLVNWVGGLEAKDGANKSRRSMEDPLHSNPVLLNYGELSIGGKKVPDSTLFIGTNSGYLHAFDTNEQTPKERFAFIPKELLPVATKYYEGVGAKKYGLDGHISVWHEDTNKDRIINNNEKAYLYVGMRRGGSSYYALDVSNRDQPKLLWQINGKHHQNGPTTGFEELGQTWSKAQLADVQWNGQARKVLIFAGGYDLSEDTNFTRKDHAVGNAIYMVDAKTGALLWKTSKNSGNLKIADMKSAITGNVVAVDDNSDGFVDLLYVADLGGRIFRVDFNRTEAAKASTSANNYATGGMIADLGINNSQISHVRFYDTLDVAYSREFSWVEGAGANKRFIEKPRYMLSIGSGYRSHPLDNSAQDSFYVVFDYNTEGPARNVQGNPTYTAIRKTDLQEYKFTGSGDLNISPTVKSNNGFYLVLKNAGAGEKVLSSSITVNNVIYFTTFRPADGSNSNSCSADLGNSRLYTVALSSGEQSLITNQEINVPGIPPKPVVVVPPVDKDCTGPDCAQGEPSIIVSTEVIELKESPFPLKKTFWREINIHGN